MLRIQQIKTHMCQVHNSLTLGTSPIDAILYIQNVRGGNVNILGGYSIGHSKQKTLYEHLSYSERFPR